MKELKKRRLGRTNLMVAELGFGAMNIPEVEESEALKTLSLALDLGVNFVDTARAYGHSELLIGKVVKTREKDFYLATKTLSRTKNGALRDIDKSRSYLGVDRIDLYQLHDVSPEDWPQVMSKDGALQGLRHAQSLGFIDYIGISSHTPQVLRMAISSGEFDTVQLKYSPFERETEDVIQLAEERDVGVIVMKPLGGYGMHSTLKYKEGGTFLTPRVLLWYVLSNPYISVAIPGVRFPWEVEENFELATSYQPMAMAEKSKCETEADVLFSAGDCDI